MRGGETEREEGGGEGGGKGGGRERGRGLMCLFKCLLCVCFVLRLRLCLCVSSVCVCSVIMCLCEGVCVRVCVGVFLTRKDPRCPGHSRTE